MTSKNGRSQRRFGPIWLSPSISKFNTASLFFAGMMILVFVTTQGLLHPYLLHEHLKMPTEIQGEFTGNLVFITEIVAIFVIMFAGLLSDRVGRRPTYVAGFLLLCFSFVLIPFARTPVILIVYRVIATVALSGSLMMLAAIIADYPQNRSRGSLIGINGVITGIGIVLIGALTFAQLPDYFVAQGVEPIMAGTYTYLIVAATAAFSVLGVRIGLKGGQANAGARATAVQTADTHRDRSSSQKPAAGTDLRRLFRLSRRPARVCDVFLIVAGRRRHRSGHDACGCIERGRSFVWHLSTGDAVIHTGHGVYRRPY